MGQRKANLPIIKEERDESNFIPEEALQKSEEARRRRKKTRKSEDPFNEDRISSQPSKEEVKFMVPDDTVKPG